MICSVWALRWVLSFPARLVSVFSLETPGGAELVQAGWLAGRAPEGMLPPSCVRWSWFLDPFPCPLSRVGFAASRMLIVGLLRCVNFDCSFFSYSVISSLDSFCIFIHVPLALFRMPLPLLLVVFKSSFSSTSFSSSFLSISFIVFICRMNTSLFQTLYWSSSTH